MISYKKNHSIYDEMRAVHSQMLNQYNYTREAAPDIARAKIMTKYLRAFKQIGNKQGSGTSPIQTSLEEQAMAEIANMVGKTLGINAYSLFRNQHFWYSKGDRSSKNLWGADDVFEAELMQFLNIAIERASNGTALSDAKLVGDLPGNISKEIMTELSTNAEQLLKDTQGNELITAPQYRAGKIDVTSFSANITATINPQWNEFVSAFAGAKFTVKNYSSTSGTEIIHLGNTNIAKSLLGTLSDLNYGAGEATHIFYHSLAYANKGNSIIGEHILHMRFAYELTGGGLFDSEGHRLDSADFFVYNDPVTDNIYVRSTKAMIADAMKYMSNVRDPLKSNIVILKSSF